MTEDQHRHGTSSDPPPGALARDGRSLEDELIRLATAAGLCVARARLEMPGQPAATVRRCVDAALVLIHATERVVEALGAEELSADERAILGAMRGDHREQGEEP